MPRPKLISWIMTTCLIPRWSSLINSWTKYNIRWKKWNTIDKNIILIKEIHEFFITLIYLIILKMIKNICNSVSKLKITNKYFSLDNNLISTNRLIGKFSTFESLKFGVNPMKKT
jgi:hypothetical protein